MRNLIQPLDFANLVATAQALRYSGQSKIEAARRSCHEHGISDDWSVPLISFINDSPSAADHWSERIFDQSLSRMAAQVEADNGRDRI